MHLKEFALRRHFWINLFTQDHLGKCSPTFSHQYLQKLLQQWCKVVQLLLELVTDLSIIHVVLILRAYRIQELWGHGSFHPDFKERLVKPGNVCGQVSIPAGSP
jgi:hypothetical protein